MKLDYAFLAERAARLNDGRLMVFGGDVDAIEVDALPAVIQLTIVARVFLYPEEEIIGHTFGIEATSATGKRIVAAACQPINTIRNVIEPDQPAGAGLIVNLTTEVDRPGTHLVHFLIDSNEVKTLRLRVDISRKVEEGN